MEDRFFQAVGVLPPRLRRQAERLKGRARQTLEELRLRVGQPMMGVFPEGERNLGGPDEPAVEESELRQTLEIATRASVHTALEQIRNGFVTLPGGHRIGLCGTAAVKEGAVYTFRCLSSLNLRLARSVPNASAGVRDKLTEGGRLMSTLILSPPGGGKTTLLRDLIRCASDGLGMEPLRVGVADERGELAALYQGRPQLDVGRHTDVIEGCAKATGLMMLLRGMGPQVLAADEITAPEDCAALTAAANCGVILLASAHAESMEELRRRAIYEPLLVQRAFQKVVTIRRQGEERKLTVEDMG